MPIIVCGINHKTAPIALREQAVFHSEKIQLYLSDLLTHENIQEAVILSTCNRSEIYCDALDVNQIMEWFCRQHQLSPKILQPALYIHQEEAAIRHIMEVACGLDSMVLGEPEILGQMKEAFSESCAAGGVGSLFNRLFQNVFSVAKEVRANTAIGACPVSVASAAVGLAKKVFLQIESANVLVIGSGATAELILRYLESKKPKQLIIANRHTENAINLAKTYQAEVMSLKNLDSVLEKVDIVFSATGSTLPIIGKPLMAEVMKKRTKPITMIDIAVPRDIDPAISEIDNISLYCIDDLKSIIQQNLQGREHAANKAREVIQKKTKEFVAWQHSLNMVSTTISAYRKHIEEISQVELAKAFRQLQRGDDPSQVIAGFAYTFTNKLLHTPSVQLRQAGVEGRVDVLQIAQELFAITKPESESI